MLFRTAALMAAILAPTAAQALEYRIMTLSDGRVLNVELNETKATGLDITVPCGSTSVPFDFLIEMAPSDPTEYLSQEDWVIYVAAPDALAPRLKASFTAMPGIQVHGEEGVDSPITEDQNAFAVACEEDMECLVAALADAPWTWIITAGSLEDGSVKVDGRLSTGITNYSAIYDPKAIESLQNANYASLGLKPVGSMPVLEGELWVDVKSPAVSIKVPKLPTTVTAPAPTGPSDAGQVMVQSFVPLPGFPSLSNGDMGGFGLSMATVVPGTALWALLAKRNVNPGGRNPGNGGKLILQTAVGYYAMSIVASQAFGLRGDKSASDVVVLPMADPTEGSVGVQLAVPLR